MVQKQSQGVLVVLIVSLAAFALLAAGAYVWLGAAAAAENPAEALSGILTNLAAVGSITAGFSLAAFAAVMSRTKAMTILARDYGAGVRTIVILGQGVTVLAALACALGSGMPDVAMMRWLAAGAAGVLASTLIVTILLMHSILGWQEQEKYIS